MFIQTRQLTWPTVLCASFSHRASCTLFLFTFKQIPVVYRLPGIQFVPQEPPVQFCTWSAAQMGHAVVKRAVRISLVNLNCHTGGAAFQRKQITHKHRNQQLNPIPQNERPKSEGIGWTPSCKSNFFPCSKLILSLLLLNAGCVVKKLHLPFRKSDLPACSALPLGQEATLQRIPNTVQSSSPSLRAKVSITCRTAAVMSPAALTDRRGWWVSADDATAKKSLVLQLFGAASLRLFVSWFIFSKLATWVYLFFKN